MMRRTLVFVFALLTLSACSLVEDAILDSVLDEEVAFDLVSESLVGEAGATTAGLLAASPDADPPGTAGLLGRVDDEGATRVVLPAAFPTDEAIDRLITDEDRALLTPSSPTASALDPNSVGVTLTHGAVYALGIVENQDVTFALRRDLLMDLNLTRVFLEAPVGTSLLAVLGEFVSVDLLLAPSVTLFDGAPPSVEPGTNLDLGTVEALGAALIQAAKNELSVGTYEGRTYVVPMIGYCIERRCILRPNRTIDQGALSAVVRLARDDLSTVERILATGATSNGVLLGARFAFDAILPASTEFKVDWYLINPRVGPN